MASPPAMWSFNASLTWPGGLKITVTAANILPGCGQAPALAEPDKKPRAFKFLPRMKGTLARVTSVWRRKKPPRAAAAKPGSRTQAIPSLLDRALMRPATTAALCSVAALAVAAASVTALRLVTGFLIPSASCGSWRCFLAKKSIEFLGPPLFEWISGISLKLVEFLDPRALGEWFGLPKLGLRWLFSK